MIFAFLEVCALTREGEREREKAPQRGEAMLQSLPPFLLPVRISGTCAPGKLFKLLGFELQVVVWEPAPYTQPVSTATGPLI